MTGVGEGIMVEKRREWSKNMYGRPMDVDNSVGIDCGSRGWDGQRRAKGEIIEKIVKHGKIIE